VEGEGKFERVSGTSIGGGTFLGLGKLLTKCKRWVFLFLKLMTYYWLLYRSRRITIGVLHNSVSMSCWN